MKTEIPFIRYKAPKKAQQKAKVKSTWKPKGPFRFFDLPAELRARVYEFALVLPRTLDLDITNYKRISPRLDLFLTCRRVYEESYPIFYGGNTFRLFPITGQFFTTRYPLLARLPDVYRKMITTVELRLGTGWTAPPKGWNVNARLGLADCKSLRLLRIHVELDPSDDIFRAFRVSKTFYTEFSGKLLEKILNAAPSIRQIEIEAFSCVPKDSPLLLELLSKAKAAEKRIIWGSEINRPVVEIQP